MPISNCYLVNKVFKQYYLIKIYPQCNFEFYDYIYILNKIGWKNKDVLLFNDSDLEFYTNGYRSLFTKIDTYEVYTPAVKRRRICSDN